MRSKVTSLLLVCLLITAATNALMQILLRYIDSVPIAQPHFTDPTFPRTFDLPLGQAEKISMFATLSVFVFVSLVAYSAKSSNQND